jgi:hypothetical protein
MKILIWFAMNGLFASCVYFGLVEGIEGARNIAVFSTYFLFFGTICFCAPSGKKFIRERLEKGLSVPRWMDAAFDICIVLSFVWFGYFVTGIVYLLHLIIGQSLIVEALEEIAKEK